MARRMNAVEDWRARRDDEIRRVTSYRDISTGEFLTEMILGVPRGARRMWRDTCDHPIIVGGVVGTIVALGAWLPNPYARVFSRGLLWLGTGVSGVFIARGTWNGVSAWRDNDRAGLREASTDFGVGVISLGMAYGGYRVAQSLGKTPEMAQRWGALGSVLHSSDEIAATLAVIRGASRVSNGSSAY
ncbi:MAG TPA: hypothetical protein VJP40_04330 [bacterium]|nr:hypothetical protein [bacterium]